MLHTLLLTQISINKISMVNLPVTFQESTEQVNVTKIFDCYICKDTGEVSDHNGEHWSEWGTKPCICQV
jgi:hypothetical protein